MRKYTMFLVSLAACTDATPLGPAVQIVDRTPPRLEIVSPQRGLIQPGTPGRVEVRGFVRDDRSGARVQVNGVVGVVGSADGSFAVQVPVHEGMTFLHTVATDGAGNTAGDTRAVLAGSLVPTETPAGDAIVARLDSRAVRVGGELLAARLAGADLTRRVTNPIVDNPIPCVAARADVTRLAHGNVTLALSPIEGGLAIDATVENLSLGLRVLHSTSCNSKASLDVTAAARQFRMRGTLRLGVDGEGLVAVDRSATDAWVDGLAVNGELPSRTLAQIEGPIAAALAQLYADHIGGHVPSVILRGLGANDRIVELSSGDLELTLRPTQLWVDYTGIGIAVDTQVKLPPGGSGAVYLASGASSLPALAGGDAIAVGISDDAVNQLLSSLWGAGAFDGSLAAAAPVAPAAVTPRYDAVELSPRLPPVVTALQGGAGLRIAFGDVECAFIKQVPGGPGETVARVSLSAEITVSVSANGDQLRFQPVHRQLFVDSLDDNLVEPHAFTGSDVDAAGFWASERLMELMNDRVSHLPLPAARGTMFAAGTAYLTRPVEGYVVIRGDAP